LQAKTIFLHVAVCLTMLSAAASPAQDQSSQTGAKQNLASAQQSADRKSNHATSAVMQVEINAPPQVVWDTLTNFSKYPVIFKKIQSCQVIKRDGDLVFTETYLRRNFFINEPCQHTVNNLTGAPHVLTWRALDGNFKQLDGCWQLKPCADGNHCLATYTLEVDAGGVIPSPLVSILLHGNQRDIVASLKHSAETSYSQHRARG
jgi:coenzyme Q-binding protein COQ10